MITGWIQSTLIVVALALLAALMNQLPPQFVNAVRLFNGFIITLLLVWLIRDQLAYHELLVAHRADLLNVFRYEEDKRRQEFETLKAETKAIADRLAQENQQRHSELTQTIADLKKTDGSA